MVQYLVQNQVRYVRQLGRKYVSRGLKSNVHVRGEYKGYRFIEYLRVVEEGNRRAELFQLKLADDNRIVHDNPGDAL